MGRPGDMARAIHLAMGREIRRFVRPEDDPCDPGSSEPRLTRKERKHGQRLIVHSATVQDLARFVKMHDTQLRQILKKSPGIYDQVKKMQWELSRPDREQAALEATIAEHDRGVRA